MLVTDPRLSDAACLAAADVDCSNIGLFHYKPKLIVRDMARPIQDQTLYSGPDTDIEAAENAYRVAFFRQIITAALNVN